jgi:hypothetical protein
MAMLRPRAARSSTVDARLLLSTGSPAEVLYRSELMRLAAGDGLAVHHTFTRDPPAAWRGFARRLDADMLKAIGPAPHDVHGSSSAARPRSSAAADPLVQLGHESKRIPVEDFGPMGAEPTSTSSADESKSSRRAVRILAAQAMGEGFDEIIVSVPVKGWPRPKRSPRPPSTSRAMTRTTSTPPRCTLTAGGLASDRRALSGSRTGLLWRTHIGRIVGSVIAVSRNSLLATISVGERSWNTLNRPGA